MTGYSVKVAESSMELSAKQRVAFKDTSNAIKLDEACTGATVTIDVAGYVVLDIHNEKSDNVDYKNYLIIDKSGEKYVTGSESFFTSFLDIYNEMIDCEEPWTLECYKLPSKNYKGKDFLTCSIA